LSTSPVRTVKIHGSEAFAAMHEAGRLAAETLDMIAEQIGRAHV